MSSYRYSPLAKLNGFHTIRLIRLLPSKDVNSIIECKLFDYFLPHKDNVDHIYEALSYVWGGTSSPQNHTIHLNNCIFNIKRNLYAALSSIRNRHLERIIWIDAICINQDDLKEREHQIQHMAKIYGMAKSVMIWLGEAAEGSDQALDAIGRVAQTGLDKPILTRELCNDVLREVSLAAMQRPAKLRNTHYLRKDILEEMGIIAKKSPASPKLSKDIRNSVLKLLERPWFRRIWVLQEAAAARQILIMCGAEQIDGHAFCLGLKLMNLPNEGLAKSQTLIRSVVFLISQAIFRPKSTSWWSGRTSLEITTMAELIDLYHGHDATERHDKIFALLGMSSDDLSGSGLSPDYTIPWEELFKNLVLSVFGKSLSIEYVNGDMVTGMAKGYVVGEVSSVGSDISWTDRQQVEVTFWNKLLPSGGNWAGEKPPLPHRDRAVLSFLISANPVLKGDLICVFKHNPTPVVVRARKDYFEIVKFAAVPKDTDAARDWDADGDNSSTKTDYEKWAEALKSTKIAWVDLLLVWQWREPLQQQEYDEVKAKWSIQNASTSKTERLSKVAIVMAGTENIALTSQTIEDAIKFCKLSVGSSHPDTLTCMDALGLLWTNHGKWKKAEAILVQVIKSRILVQGENHQDTRNSLQIFDDLGCTLNKLQHRTDAERIAFIKEMLEGGENIIVDEDLVTEVANLMDKKTMNFLLNTRGHEFKVTEGIMKAAMQNSEGPDEVAYLLLDKRKDEVKITEEIFQIAAERCGSRTRILPLLLEQRGAEFRITEEIIEAAAANECPDVLHQIVQHRGHEVKITDRVLQVAARNRTPEVMGLVLLHEKAEHEVKITHNVLQLAAWNRNPEVMELLLRHGKVEAKITEDVFQFAAGNPSTEVMQLMLQHQNGEFKITDQVLEIAAGNSGSEMMGLLLEYAGDEITIPIAAIRVAAENWSKEVMERMLQHREDKFSMTEEVIEIFVASKVPDMVKLLLQYRGHDVKPSEGIVEKAMRERSWSWVLECLRRDRKKELVVTERILIAVAENAEMLRMIVDSRGDEIQITPQILAAVAKGKSGYDMIRLLLEEKGYEVVVTEDALRAAAGNNECGKEIMELLLDLRGDEVIISEEIVKAAVRNLSRGAEIMELLLTRRREEVMVTEEVVKAAASFDIVHKAEVMLLLLKRLEDYDSIPDAIFNAIPEKWNTKEKCMRDFPIIQELRQKQRRRKERFNKGQLSDDYDSEE